MGELSRKLLIVEDDPGLLSQLRWCFEGYEVFAAEDRESAIAELRRHEPMVVLQDLGLPPRPEGVEEGFACLAQILKLAPHTKVIVVTGNGDQENALTAVAQGAYDFYEKPVDTDTLKLLVDRAFNISELEAENRRLQSKVAESPLDGIVDQQHAGAGGFAVLLGRHAATFLTVPKTGSAQVTATLVTSVVGTSPLPFATLQVWAGFVGWVATVTL